MKLIVAWRRDIGRKIGAVFYEFPDWRGEIPRIGEYVVVFEEFCAEEVRHVYHNLHDGSIEIELAPDFGGEYRDHIAAIRAKATP